MEKRIRNKFFFLLVILGWIGADNSYSQNCSILAPNDFVVGVPVSFELQCDNPTGLSILWEFGDGNTLDYAEGQLKVSHTYLATGAVTVFARIKGQFIPYSSFHNIINTPTAIRPVHSNTILLDTSTNLVWTVNPDNHTVVAYNITSNQRSQEIPVGKYPRTLAQDGAGNIWVCNQESETITILGAGGTGIGTINLPYASRPYAVVIDPAKEFAYVSLQATGQLVKINAATRQVLAIINLGYTPRAIAVDHTGNRVLVTRWISSDSVGVVYEVSKEPFQWVRNLTLAMDTTADSESNGRGIPNALNDIIISPDGNRAWVSSKKDNIQRGTQLDGNPINFENTVRTIVSAIDLKTNQEILTAREDLNDRSMAYGLEMDPLGKFLYISTQGTNDIVVLRGSDGEPVTAIEPNQFVTQMAPEGIVLDNRSNRLYIQYYTSRELGVYDVANVGTTNVTPRLQLHKTVEQDSLTEQQLYGKQIFYNAKSGKMNTDSYITCNTCHLEGAEDGQNYDRFSRGEGLRNTTSLLGKGGLEHGPLFWTATSDEIQDSEGGIRSFNEGLGFMSDASFSQGTVSQNWGDPKAGLSVELDALASYISSLTTTPRSPYRSPDGTMTLKATLGKAVFERNDVGCAECHAGDATTTSSFTDNKLYDVGTFTSLSGKASGGNLVGLDVPTVNGVWATAPFLHDGSAKTLMEVLTTKNTGDKHGITSHLTPAELDQLVQYMLELEDRNSVNSLSVLKSPRPSSGPSFNVRRRGSKIIVERGQPFNSRNSKYYDMSGRELD